MAKRRPSKPVEDGRKLVQQLAKAAGKLGLSWRVPLMQYCLDRRDDALSTEIPITELLGGFADIDAFLPAFSKLDEYHRRLIVFILAQPGGIGDLGSWLKKYLPREKEGEDYYGLVVESLRRVKKEDISHLIQYAIQDLCCFRKDGQPNSVGRYLQQVSAKAYRTALSSMGIGSAHDTVRQRNYQALMKLAAEPVAQALDALYRVKKTRDFVVNFLWFYLPVNPRPLLPLARKAVANMTYPYHRHMYNLRIRRCEKIASNLAKRRQKAAKKS